MAFPSKKFAFAAGIIILIFFGAVIASKMSWISIVNAPTPTPGSDETENWKIYRDEEAGIEFRYPETLGLKYITPVDWPPKVIIGDIDPNFECAQLYNVKTPEGYGSQQEVKINNHVYCVLTADQGAAGTTYRIYQYATNKGSKQLVFDFVLKFPTDCGVYGDENKKADCQKEKDEFDINILIDKVLSTFRFLR